MTVARSTTAVSEDGGDGRPVGLQPFAAGPVAVVAAALAALLTVLSGRYGFHRDELYFLVAGGHPDWGYIDQPPLTPLLARASTALFGDTPAGLRVLATLTAVLAVGLVALIARELGGDRRAQTIAAACTAASGLTMVLGHMVSTAGVDLLAWLLLSWLVLRLLRTGDPRWYPAIGAVVGIGLQNKRLIALLVVGLLLALVAVGPRRVLRSWWLLAGAAIAVAVALPNLWWEAAHGWPQFDVASGISEEDGAENRVMFGFLQIVHLSPLLVPIWVAGLIRLWRDPTIRWARAFAVAYPLVVLATLASGGKSYYVLPLLMVAMAAGAVPVARWSRTGRRGQVIVAAIAVAAAINAVITLPVLPPSSLHLVQPMNDQQGEQVGWQGMVATVADAWNQIPPAERARSVILVQNYGEAAAIGRYGPDHGLPAPYSGHMSYADWGPPPDSADGSVLLVHAEDNSWIPRLFTGCRRVSGIDNEYDLDNELWENVVQLCSGADRPWSRLWPTVRHY